MRPLKSLAFGSVDPRAEEVMVTMRDGIRLATDVYLPAPKGRFPAVLIRLPYDKSGEFSFMSQIATRLLEMEIAVVVQDVRGKIRSEGRTYAFVHEMADGFDTVEWLIAQSWSNGDVATFGDSYYGYTQWALAATHHPALRAMVPRMTTTEVATDWMYQNGVFNLGSMGEWALHTWIDNSLNELAIDWSVRPLVDFIQANTQGDVSDSFQDWISHPPDDPYWVDVTLGSEASPWGAIPTLHVGGWFDVFSRGQLRDYERALSGPMSQDQYLLMSATDHFDDEIGPEGFTADYLKDKELLAKFLDGYIQPALDFFAKYLLGEERAIPNVRYQVAHGSWHISDTWPPQDSVPMTWYLDAPEMATRGPLGGILQDHVPTLDGSVAWIHDPNSPVPSEVQDPWRPLLRLPDERRVLSRPDVLTFTTNDFPAGLTVCGPVQVSVLIDAQAPSTMIIARLLDVFPDGRSHFIVEGVQLVRDTAEPQICEVDLGDTAYFVRPGHRLTLQISASSFPRWPVHPGTTEDPLHAIESVSVLHTLSVDPNRPSFLSVFTTDAVDGQLHP